jgi:Holliday junction resolvasome RuvABC DNA-binding subunit
LREKISDGLVSDLNALNGSTGSRTLAREGLVGLGYDLTAAEAMLAATACEGEDQQPEELIAAALRAAAAKGH